MRSYAELLDASGYASRPKDFDDLLRILDNEIRLITPTDPEGTDQDGRMKHESGRIERKTLMPTRPIQPSSFILHPLATTSSRTTTWSTPCATG